MFLTNRVTNYAKELINFVVTTDEDVEKLCEHVENSVRRNLQETFPDLNKEELKSLKSEESLSGDEKSSFARNTTVRLSSLWKKGVSGADSKLRGIWKRGSRKKNSDQKREELSQGSESSTPNSKPELKPLNFDSPRLDRKDVDILGLVERKQIMSGDPLGALLPSPSTPDLTLESSLYNESKMGRSNTFSTEGHGTLWTLDAPFSSPEYKARSSSLDNRLSRHQDSASWAYPFKLRYEILHL